MKPKFKERYIICYRNSTLGYELILSIFSSKGFKFYNLLNKDGNYSHSCDYVDRDQLITDIFNV